MKRESRVAKAGKMSQNLKACTRAFLKRHQKSWNFPVLVHSGNTIVRIRRRRTSFSNHYTTSQPLNRQAIRVDQRVDQREAIDEAIRERQSIRVNQATE